MGNASHLAALMLLFGAATADAQVSPPVTTTGSYQQLSVGNQKIARALFEAQVQPTTTTTSRGTSGSTTSSPKPLTLDQIAGLKQSGTGWGQVFKQMHDQGLVTEKNLGQVVSRYNRTTHATSGSSTVVTASNKPQSASVTRGPGKSDVDGGASTSAGNQGQGSASYGNSQDYGRGGSGGGQGNANGRMK